MPTPMPIMPRRRLFDALALALASATGRGGEEIIVSSIGMAAECERVQPGRENPPSYITAPM
ncbi:hypothetical protein C5E11_14885 [Clavibacter michiganensis]|nr:hypothetical protein C5E11_14885 [Clavibacter michiganensis]